MRRRTVRGIALLLGLSSAVLGCSSNGGGSYGPTAATGGASTSSATGGAAGSGGSDADSDGSAGEGGSASSDGGNSTDATPDRADARADAADVATDARADAADVSVSDVGSSDGSPDGRPDVSVEAGGDASLDARPDVSGAVDARSDAADVAVDRGATPDAPPSSGKTCVERCNADPDCAPTLPVADFECDLATHRCVVCRNDLACVAAASGWIVGCAQSSDCQFVGDVCIDVNGAGKCAFSKSACAGSFPDDIQARELGTGAAVTVCGVATSECHAGQCVDRCSPMHTCTPQQGGKVCNETTGKCECAGDGDCSGGVGVSKCNTITKQCECAGNSDCAGVDDVDICVDGKCRCSSVSVCKRDFTGTTLSCE